MINAISVDEIQGITRLKKRATDRMRQTEEVQAQIKRLEKSYEKSVP